MPDMTAILARVVAVVHHVHSRNPKADSWRVTWNRRGKIRFEAMSAGEEKVKTG